MTKCPSQPVPVGMDTHHGSETLRFPHRGGGAQQGCQDQGHAQADPKVESWKEVRRESCGQMPEA